MISDKARKKFTPPFEETIKSLYVAGLGPNKGKISAFKNFINEFGTHYAAITELGTKLTIERRYSSKVMLRFHVFFQYFKLRSPFFSLSSSIISVHNYYSLIMTNND